MDMSQIDSALRPDTAFTAPNAATPRAPATQNDRFSNLLNARLRASSPDEPAEAGDEPPQSAAPISDDAANAGNRGASADATQGAVPSDEIESADIAETQLVDASSTAVLTDPTYALPIALPLPLPAAAAPSGLDFTLDAQLRSAGVVAALEATPAPAAPVAAAPQSVDIAGVPAPVRPKTGQAEGPVPEPLPPTLRTAQTRTPPSEKPVAGEPAAASQPVVAPAVPTAATPVAAPTAQALPESPVPAAVPGIETVSDRSVAMTAAAPMPANPIKKTTAAPDGEAAATESVAVAIDAELAPVEIKVVSDRRPAAPSAPIVANFKGPAQPALPMAAQAVGTQTPAVAAAPEVDESSDHAFAAAIEELGSDDVKPAASRPATDIPAPAVPHANMAPQPAASVADTTATATATRPPLHPVVEQVVMHVAKAAGDSMDRIKIELRPLELGRIDVRMEIGPDGRVQAVFAADRPQTMELLQRDARQLERALQDAGLNVDSGSLSFDLRGNGNNAGNAFAEAFTPSRPGFDVPTELLAASQAYVAPGLGSGRLDIRV